MNQVTERLWIGDITDAINIAQLKANGIVGILSLIENMERYWLDNVPQAVWTEFTRRGVPLQDGMQDQEELFRRALHYAEELIDELKLVTLIHCGAGISRASTTVCLYLVKTKQQPDWDTAVTFVRSKRPIIFPNPNLVVSAKKVLGVWPYDGSLGTPGAPVA